MTQTRQLSRRTVEDAVRIQPPERCSLRQHFAIHPGGQNDRAGIPSSMYTAAGSRFWGSGEHGYGQTDDTGD